MKTSFFRYTLGCGNFDSCDSIFIPICKLDRPERLDGEVMLQTFQSAMTKEGFTLLDSHLEVRVKQVWLFREEEFELSVADVEPDLQNESWLTGLDGALEMVTPEMVVLIAYRKCHNSGSSYDFRVLAVPKGSQLPKRSENYHHVPFDKEINWMWDMDSNSQQTVYLPQGALIWNGKEWEPITRIKYYY